MSNVVGAESIKFEIAACTKAVVATFVELSVVPRVVLLKFVKFKVELSRRGDFLLVSGMEKWLSGRKRFFAKEVNLKRVPRVRIPPSPPFKSQLASGQLWAFQLANRPLLAFLFLYER